MIQLVCSNCNADLKDLPIRGGRIQCPYCGAINEFTGYNDSKDKAGNAESSKIYYEPVTLSVDDVDNICTDALGEDELAPDDIYQEMTMKGYKLMYLPFCVVGGNYTYSLSYTKNGANSSKNGSDSIYKRYLLYTGSDVALPLREKINQSSQSTKSPLQFTADEGAMALLKKDDKIIVCEPSISTKYLYSLLENEAKELAIKKVEEGATNTSAKIVSSFLCDSVVYVPYYIVELMYKGQPYYMAVCASSSGGLYSVLPVDEERAKTFKELTNHMSPLVVTLMCLPFILGLIWIFGPLTFGNFFLLSIVSWSIGLIIYMIEDNKNKKIKAQILEESRKNRLMHKI